MKIYTTGVYYSYSRKHRDKGLPKDTPSGIVAFGYAERGVSLTDIFSNTSRVVLVQLGKDHTFKLPSLFMIGEVETTLKGEKHEST